MTDLRGIRLSPCEPSNVVLYRSAIGSFTWSVPIWLSLLSFVSFVYHHPLVWLVAFDVLHLLVAFSAACFLWICCSYCFLFSLCSFFGDSFSFKGLIFVFSRKPTYVWQWLHLVLLWSNLHFCDLVISKGTFALFKRSALSIGKVESWKWNIFCYRLLIEWYFCILRLTRWLSTELLGICQCFCSIVFLFFLLIYLYTTASVFLDGLKPWGA